MQQYFLKVLLLTTTMRPDRLLWWCRQDASYIIGRRFHQLMAERWTLRGEHSQIDPAIWRHWSCKASNKDNSLLMQMLCPSDDILEFLWLSILTWALVIGFADLVPCDTSYGQTSFQWTWVRWGGNVSTIFKFHCILLWTPILREVGRYTWKCTTWKMST